MIDGMEVYAGMEYKEFRIIIENEEKIRLIKSSGISLRGNVQRDPLKIQTIDLFNRWLAQGKISERDELTVLGSYLYALLFEEKISQEFKDEFDKIRKQPGTGLRLILEFELPARKLAEMPWEYLYYPNSDREKGFFIAPREKLILARHVPINIEIPEPIGKPLRILVVSSKPEGEGLGNVLDEPTIDAIRDLGEKYPGLFEITILKQPTKVEFYDMIKEIHPHILHFIGHGKYNDGGYLALVSSDGKTPFWINDLELADCFQDFQPRLVFLQACEGAHSESYEAFRGVALQLVYSKIPAVVAMQYPIENRVANSFSIKFYQSLSEGDPVDVATQKGRAELAVYLDERNFSSRAFGSPVVYVQGGAETIIVK
jgi:hypothetical protein